MAHTHDRTYLAKLGFGDKDRQNPIHDLACQYLAQPEKMKKLIALAHPDEVAACKEKEGKEFTWSGTVTAEEVLRDGYGLEDIRIDVPELIPDLDKQRYLGPDYKYTSAKFDNLVFTRRRTYNARITENWIHPHLSRPISPTASRVIGYYDLYIYAHFFLNCAWSDKTFVRVYHDGSDFELPAVALKGPVSGTAAVAEHECEDRSQKGHYHEFHIPKRSVAYELAVEVKNTPISINAILQQVLTYRKYDEDTVQIVATLFKLDTVSREALDKQGVHHIYLDPREVEAFGESLKIADQESF